MKQDKKTDSMEGWKRDETIRCPECNSLQAAVVEYTYPNPFASYIHHCTCGYIIMESEWDKVSNKQK